MGADADVTPDARPTASPPAASSACTPPTGDAAIPPPFSCTGERRDNEDHSHLDHTPARDIDRGKGASGPNSQGQPRGLPCRSTTSTSGSHNTFTCCPPHLASQQSTPSPISWSPHLRAALFTGDARSPPVLLAFTSTSLIPAEHNPPSPAQPAFNPTASIKTQQTPSSCRAHAVCTACRVAPTPRPPPPPPSAKPKTTRILSCCRPTTRNLPLAWT